MKKMFTPITLGEMTLPHRLVMSPMTRSRAQENGVPREFTVTYYEQRASMGLLISEGVQPSDDGQGYMNTPGIYREEHIVGWKKVTDAVHTAGGHFFMQLMHAGRMAHPANTPHGRQPVAPSAIAPNTTLYTPEGLQEVPTPRALTKDEIQETIQDFVHAAKSAIAAGADGVEIHGASGYLIQQFFMPSSNQREDEYGGSKENRARFGLEVAKAIADAIGKEKVGFRISPGDLPFNGIQEGEQSMEFYDYFAEQLAKLDIAYLHLMHFGNDPLLQMVRKKWPHTLIVNRAGRPLEQIDEDIENNLADISAIGVWALANPDFIDRLKKNAPLNEPDPTTFYGGEAKGYIDYPTLNE